MVRLYRGEEVETADGDALLTGRFPDGEYVDVPGLCKVASRTEIEAQGWSLNPGRYTGTAAVDDAGEDFADRLASLYDEFARASATRQTCCAPRSTRQSKGFSAHDGLA